MRIKILLFSLALCFSLEACETAWGTIYNPSQLEFDENIGAIMLQEYQWSVEAGRHNNDEAYRMAVYPIQRAYALLGQAYDANYRNTVEGAQIAHFLLKEAYLVLATGDGTDHYTEGEEELHASLDDAWSHLLRENPMLYEEK